VEVKCKSRCDSGMLGFENDGQAYIEIALLDGAIPDWFKRQN
jgi:hypothetical protein